MTEFTGTIGVNNYEGVLESQVLGGIITSTGGGTELDYKEYTIDRTYIYQGADNLTYVPIPYGCRYPINQAFDGTTNYNFCEELYLNGNLLIKDTDWREANIDEIDGFYSNSTGAYFPGMGSIKNFAHMVILINGTVLNNSDQIRMKVKQRRLLTTRVEGIRLGNTEQTSNWGDEVTTITYNYAVNDNSTDNQNKLPQTGVFWNYPNEDKYKVCLFFLSTKSTGKYSGSSLGSGKYHQGVSWRYMDYVASTTGQLALASNNSKGAFKLAVFDIETGAMSDLCTESIIRKWNKKWSGIDGPLAPNVVIR